MKDNSMNLSITNSTTADINLTLDGNAIVTITDSTIGAINLTLTNGTAEIKNVDSSIETDCPTVNTAAIEPITVDNSNVEFTIGGDNGLFSLNNDFACTLTATTAEAETIPATVEPATIEPPTVEPATVESFTPELQIIDTATVKPSKLIEITRTAPIISVEDFHTILLHAEKISNGQTDLIPVLAKELIEKLKVGTPGVMTCCLTTKKFYHVKGDTIDGYKFFTQQLLARKFFIKDNETDIVYAPPAEVGGDLEIISIGSACPNPALIAKANSNEQSEKPSAESTDHKANEKKDNNDDDPPKKPSTPKKNGKKTDKKNGATPRCMTKAYAADFPTVPPVDTATTDQLCYLLQKSTFEIELFQGAKGKMYLPLLNAAYETQLKAEQKAALLFSQSTIAAHKHVGALVAKTFQDKAIDLEYVKYDYYSKRYGYVMQPLTYNTLTLTIEPSTDPQPDPPTTHGTDINDVDMKSAIDIDIMTELAADGSIEPTARKKIADNLIAMSHDEKLPRGARNAAEKALKKIDISAIDHFCAHPEEYQAAMKKFNPAAFEPSTDPQPEDSTQEKIEAAIAQRGYDTNKIIVCGLPSKSTDITTETTDKSDRGGLVSAHEETPKTDTPTIEPPIVDAAACKVKTDKGTIINAHYAIVSAEHLFTSHKIDGGAISKNENYPADYQPRDRESVTLTQQVNRMASNLDPAELTASVYLNQGAPIVTPNGTVLNGNGRTLAIQKAYEENLPSAKRYKDYLIEHAADFGLSPSHAQNLKQPILTRVLNQMPKMNNWNLYHLFKEIAESTIGGSSLSSFEQAKVDAQKLRLADFSDYVDETRGDLTSPSNGLFVSKIIERLASQNDRPRYYNVQGRITKDAVARTRNAIFALAYNDDGMLDKMTLSTDEGARNISNAMIIAAPKFAKLTLQQREGIFYEYNTAEILATAINRFNYVKNNGFKSIDHYFQQQALFDRETPVVESIMRFFDAHKRSQKAIIEFLSNIIVTIKNQGHPTDTTLDGMPSPNPLTLDNIISTAINVTNENGNVNLFDADVPTEKPANDIDKAFVESEKAASTVMIDALTSPAFLASIERNAYKTIIFAKSRIASHKDAVDIAESLIGAAANSLKHVEAHAPKTHAAQIQIMKAAAALDASFIAGKAAAAYVVRTHKNMPAYREAFYNGDYDYEPRKKTTREISVDGELITVDAFDASNLPFQFDIQAAASPFAR